MSHPALRSCGALLVFLLAASPTETVAAAAKSPPAQRLGSATRYRTTAAHTRSRRLRRPPGGVVWAELDYPAAGHRSEDLAATSRR